MPSSPNSGSSGSDATARRPVSAFATYWTFMPFGSQRCVGGTVASASMPIAISARLQAAIAWNVRMWL